MPPIINIKKGDAPVAASVIQRAIEPTMAARGWPNSERQAAQVDMTFNPTSGRAVAAGVALAAFQADLRETYAINAFNAQLAFYTQAVARLSRVRLSTGREAQHEDQPTGEIDENGDPILESVLVAQAVEPAPATVEVQTFDAETGEQTGTEEIDNPDITKDEAERNNAQAVVDSTPQEVKEWEHETL